MGGERRIRHQHGAAALAAQVLTTLPRRASPRDRIPAGSRIIAGGQAIVAALAMASGWHILGRRPERRFKPDRDPAFQLAPGDLPHLAQTRPGQPVRFAPVSVQATVQAELPGLLFDIQVMKRRRLGRRTEGRSGRADPAQPDRRAQRCHASDSGTGAGGAVEPVTGLRLK